MSRTSLLLVTPLLAASFVVLIPESSSAQIRPYPGYPSYRYAAPESDLRIFVKPKEASVYIDGYFAGKVDEFDGAFQRLHVAPGEHEVVIWLTGHRSLRQRLYLSPNSTRKIEGTLEPLPAGAQSDPEPVPTGPREDEGRYERLPPRGPLPGRRPPVPNETEREPQSPPVPSQPSRFGTLSIRLKPGDATLLIDGERWAGPDGDERLIVQVSPGRHKIEAEKDGYTRFVTEVDATRDQTTTVNISMAKDKRD